MKVGGNGGIKNDGLGAGYNSGINTAGAGDDDLPDDEEGEGSSGKSTDYDFEILGKHRAKVVFSDGSEGYYNLGDLVENGHGLALNSEDGSVWASDSPAPSEEDGIQSYTEEEILEEEEEDDGQIYSEHSAYYTGFKVYKISELPVEEAEGMTRICKNQGYDDDQIYVQITPPGNTREERIENAYAAVAAYVRSDIEWIKDLKEGSLSEEEKEALANDLIDWMSVSLQIGERDLRRHRTNFTFDVNMFTASYNFPKYVSIHV